MIGAREFLAVAVALGLGGCAAMEDRRWDGCAVAGGLIGAAIGGTSAGLGVSESHGTSSSEVAGAAVGGTLVGAGLGTVLGHLACDPEVEAAPPPAPPAVTPAPPPPPPPPPPAKKK